MRLGVGKWIAQKMRPEKRRVFFSCLLVDLRLGLDSEGVIVRSCHDPSLISQKRKPSLFLVFFLCVFCALLVVLASSDQPRPAIGETAKSQSDACPAESPNKTH